MDQKEIKEQELIMLLQHTKLFSHFDYDYCKQLIPLLERTELKAGEVLFNQGEPSEGFYVVAQGILNAYFKKGSKQVILGNIASGETVGELGGISNQPRTLTVRAQTNCLLFKLTRNHLETFCDSHPGIAFHLMEIIISRAQKNIKLLSEQKTHHHALLISGDNDQLYFETFLKNLTSHAHNIIKIILKIPESIELETLLEQAESDHTILLFLIEESELENEASQEMKFNFADKLMVVVNGNKTASLSNFALKMLSGLHTPYVDRYELILLHDDEVELPKHTSYWLKQAFFSLHHHLRLNESTSYHRIIRFINGTPNVVVLGGGGGKGWVCLGALKALEDTHTPIDAIGGTSVGAMIAAYYAQTLSVEKTEYMFRKLASAIGESAFHFTNLTWPIISIISATKPTKMLQRLSEDIQIEDLWIPFFAVSCNLNSKKEFIHREKDVWVALRASGSIPGITPPMVIDGELHVDGGVINNMPTDYMRLLAGNRAKLIAVSLRGKGIKKKAAYNFPPFIPFRVGLLRKLRMGYKEYNFPPYFDTFMSSLLVGASAKEYANEDLADYLIIPNLSKYKTLRNNVKEIKELINLGYEEMVKELGK